MTTTEKLTCFTQQEFAALGMNDLAYVRTVETPDGRGFMIHAADGTPMAALPDREVAFAAARQHGLEPMSVH
ncbi:MAG: DUF1150 family protein [Alphaproteobacteria bacterium]